MKFCKMMIVAASVVVTGACSTSKEITYFQDLHPGESGLTLPSATEIRFMPGDKLTIYVSSSNPKLMNRYNLPYASQQIGTETSSSGSSRGVLSYTVDSRGDIDFVTLGTIHVGGLTREEVAAHIKQRLLADGQITDPVVTVEFANLTISVMGEVGSPGRYSLDKDKVTILDALSQAGDLTVYGKRDRVMVLRNEDGRQQVYALDLRSAGSLCSSPAYYLQQNDVVYVEPNGTKARQSTVNGNYVRNVSFWMSLASFLTTIIVLFAK